MKADCVYYNGNFITLNKEHPTASALAVKNGRILKIASYDEVKSYQKKDTKEC